MAHLRDALRLRPRFGELTLPPKPRQLEAERANVTRILGGSNPREPSPYDLMETYELVSDVSLDPATFSKLPSKHLKRIPWILFEPPREGLPRLVDGNAFLVAYIFGLKHRLFGPAIVILVHVFLRYYPVDHRSFEFLRKQLGEMVAQLDTLKGRVLNARAKEYGFFKENGAFWFSEMILGADDPMSVIADAGFEGDGSQRGFVLASVEAMLDGLAEGLKYGKVPNKRLENIFALLRGDQSSGMLLRFPSLRVKLAESLLLPYGSKTPPTDIQESIKAFLLRTYGDPRIQQGNWHSVDETARSVLVRWLVSGTLEDFFRVVREGSHQNRDADRMWPYREAFWSAYLRKGVISDAWVVLTASIAQRSREFLSGQSDGYGRLGRGYGVLNSHAVLIMRIGDLVITEWNYSGMYRVWQANNDCAPTLYRPKYTKADLTRNPDFERSHHGAETGSWQERLAVHIADWTGVRVTRREYMPE